MSYLPLPSTGWELEAKCEGSLLRARQWGFEKGFFFSASWELVRTSSLEV